MPKTFTYIQDSGVMLDETGHQIAFGWAGHGAGKNNPALQDIHDLGPLPQGAYKVGPWGDAATVPGYPAHLGPFITSLTQVTGVTYGRSGFYIHGPGGVDPGQSSKGCIEIPRADRLVVRDAAPDFIEVVPHA